MNKTYNKKYLIGDLHGTWSVIPTHLDYYGDRNVCFIQVGDFGIGFDDFDIEFSKLTKLNSLLKSYDSDLYILRGNHDNPDWFNSDVFDAAKGELSNIYFIPDYSVINIDGENILFVGGAVSIDRKDRIRNSSWWPGEVIKFDFDKAKEFRDIDRMICHTSPDFCEPLKMGQLVYDYAYRDAHLLGDLKLERANMTKLVTEIMSNNTLKGFYYGHFHRSFRFYHRDCEFICLNINQFIPL